MYYLQCENCKKRLVRTGKKAQKRETRSGWFYIREFECPDCGRVYIFDEDKKTIALGELPKALCD